MQVIDVRLSLITLQLV